MNRFYVGQRVRILWSMWWPELAGKEGVIVGKAVPNERHGEWIVAPDCWGSSWDPRAGKRGNWRFAPGSDQLAPFYDGNQTVSWSECLWRPTPEHVK